MTWRQAPGRQPNVGIKVRIPRALHAQITLLMLDPLRGRVKYGNWTDLMTSLLSRWVKEVQDEHKAPPLELDARKTGAE